MSLRLFPNFHFFISFSRFYLIFRLWYSSQHQAYRTKISSKTEHSNSKDRVCTTCKNVYRRRNSIPAVTTDENVVTSVGDIQPYILLDQNSEDGHENIVHIHTLDCEEGSLDFNFLDINHVGYPSTVGFFREVLSQLSYRGMHKAEVETEITTDFTCQSCCSDIGTNITPSKTLSHFHDLADVGEESKYGRANGDEFTDAIEPNDVTQRKNHSVAHTVLQRKSLTKQSIRKNITLKYTHTDMLSIGIVLCPLWFISNCCYNYALLYTSVSSSTVISNLSAGFTLFFSWWYGVEKITFSKILGVSICFAGVGLVALADGNSGRKSTVAAVDESTVTTSLNVLGDMMAVLGAAGYGLYTTVLRVKVRDEDSASMQLLLGYMGLVNALTLSPLLFLMVSNSFT